MGLVICISETEAEKASTLNWQMLHLCEGVVKQGGQLLYIPLSGKLIDVLKILAENGITYELRSNPS